MSLSTLHQYVSQTIPGALATVSQRGWESICPQLTSAEKALIYYYTEEGDFLAEPDFIAALHKLPPHSGKVYSGVQLWPEQLAVLQQALEQRRAVPWPYFLPTSQKPTIAMYALRTTHKNAFFIIQSRTGRSVEALSFYGPNGLGAGQNEAEVLFAPGVQFAVVALEPADGYTRVTLREV